MKLYYSSRVRLSIETPIHLMLVGMMSIQIAYPIRINALVSLGTWMIVAAALMAFALAVVKQRINDRYLFNIIILSICVLLSLIFSFSWSYQDVVVAFSFIEIPLFLAAYPKVRERSVVRKIFACYIVLSIYYLVLSFSTLSNIYYTQYGSKTMGFLTLGYNNPNETAMHLFACFIILVAMLSNLKNRFARF